MKIEDISGIRFPSWGTPQQQRNLAIRSGVLDDMAIEQVRDFEAELYRYVDATNSALLAAIMEKKILDDALKAEMTRVIKQAKEAFVAERQAVAAGK